MSATASAPGRHLPPRTAAWVVLGALVGAVVVLLGAYGSRAALPLGQVYSGLAAIAGGVAVLAIGRREGRLARYRVLMALAGLVWGGGQVLLAFEVLSGQAQFPALGDAVAGFAAPFAVLGLAMIPRRVTEPLQGLRLTFEVTMLAAAGAALAWRLAFSSVYDLGTVEGASGFALVAAELVIVSMLLTAVAREGNGPLAVVLAGVVLFVAADLVTMHTVAQAQPWPWASAAVACLAWPLIIVGTLAVPARPPVLTDRLLAGAESRRLIVHAAVLFTLVAGMLVSLLLHDPMDLLTVVLYLAVLVGFLGREVVRARQSGQLLDRLSHQALVDPLTGLRNRRSLTERLDELARYRGERSTRLSVLTLDLDGFKDINSRLGNAAGDQLLHEVGHQIADRCRSWGATAYRLGGDEFAVLYEAAPDQAAALADALTLVVRSAAASVPGLGPVALSASIGVAHSATDGALATAPGEVVLRSAQALQTAKDSGRGRVVVFTAPLAARNQRRAAIERRLRERVSRGGVDVHYQPIVSLDSGFMVGMEALARWTDDELGTVPPQEFIDVAEGCGLIDELGWQILRTALAGQVSSGACARGMTLGVNVSSLQLRAPDFARRLAALRDEFHIPAQQVVIEVTESVFVNDDGPAAENLFEIAEAGSPIALDDFGTGYSSLAYLGRLPVRILKLDRTLTAHLTEPRTLAIASCVADLARGLGLDVVVEGIETDELQAFAQAMGTGFGQGWLYEKAVPLERLPAVMQSMADPDPETVPSTPVHPLAGPDVVTSAVSRSHVTGRRSSATVLPIGPRPRSSPEDRPLSSG